MPAAVDPVYGVASFMVCVQQDDRMSGKDETTGNVLDPVTLLH